MLRHKYFLSEQSISAALNSTSLALTYIKTIILTNGTTGSTIGVSGRLEWYWGAILDVGLPGSNVFGLLTSLPCLPSICLHIRWGSQSWHWFIKKKKTIRQIESNCSLNRTLGDIPMYWNDLYVLLIIYDRGRKEKAWFLVRWGMWPVGHVTCGPARLGGIWGKVCAYCGIKSDLKVFVINIQAGLFILNDQFL